MRVKVFLLAFLVFTEILNAQSVWTNFNAGASGYYLNNITSDSTHLYLCYRGSSFNDGGILISMNSNSAWTSLINGTQCQPGGGLAANSSVIFSGGTTGTSTCGLFRSTDQGTSWTRIDSSLTLVRFTFDGDTIFAAGTFPGTYKSIDNGNSWTVLLGGVSCSSILINGTDIILGTYSAGIYISNDRGATWYTSNTGLTNLNVRCLARSGSTLYAGTYGDGLFRSDDNGQSWYPTAAATNCHVQTVSAKGPHVIIGLAPPSGPGLGYPRGIYYSPDEGGTFYETGHPTTDGVSSMIVGTTAYAVGLYGEVYKADLSDFAAIGLKKPAEKFADFTVSPNPFAESVRVSFAKEQNNRLIRVLDPMGKEIYRTTCNDKEILLERNGMHPGIYFLEVTDEYKNKSVRKIIAQ